MGKLYDYFHGRFHSFTSYAIITLAFAYVASGSFSVLSNWKSSDPVVINRLEIINPIMHIGDPIKLSFNTDVNKPHCDAYVDRAVVSRTNGETVWSGTTPLQHDVLIGAGIDKTLDVPIKGVLSGEYFYKVTVHLICGKDSYTTSSRLIPFKIISK